jgi:hypothetical protein
MSGRLRRSSGRALGQGVADQGGGVPVAVATLCPDCLP